MDRIRFTVTQEHIAAAEAVRDGFGFNDLHPRYACPVARALTARCGESWGVGQSSARPEDPVVGPLDDRRVSWYLSRRVERAVANFDAGVHIRPFTGEVYR